MFVAFSMPWHEDWRRSGMNVDEKNKPKMLTKWHKLFNFLRMTRKKWWQREGKLDILLFFPLAIAFTSPKYDICFTKVRTEKFFKLTLRRNIKGKRTPGSTFLFSVRAESWDCVKPQTRPRSDFNLKAFYDWVGKVYDSLLPSFDSFSLFTLALQED